MVPFLFMMALKVNPISMLTGISHAHLQVYHQGMAILFVRPCSNQLFFSVIHAVPMLWQPMHEGGRAKLSGLFHDSTYGSLFWSGVAAFSVLVWMVLSSLGVFRRRSYGFFVFQHVCSIMLLLGFLFYHTKDLKMLKSQFYLWAAVGAWIFSIVVRSSLVLFSSRFFTGPQACVEMHTDLPPELSTEGTEHEVLRFRFETPLHWRPGQHIYVRFPQLAPFTAHPFSIMSLPSAKGTSTLILLTKVHRGTTRKICNYVQRLESGEVATGEASEKETADRPPNERLTSETNVAVPTNSTDATPVLVPTSTSPASSFGGGVPGHPTSLHTPTGTMSKSPSGMAFQKDDRLPPLRRSSAQIRAYLDGPYGYTTDPGTYEHVVLYAGGTGIAHIFPLLLDLLQRGACQGASVLTRTVRLVWSTRSYAMAEWLHEDWKTVERLQALAKIRVTIDVHITQTALGGVTASSPVVTIHFGVRANTSGLLAEELQQANDFGSASLGVYVCGPISMVCDVSNSAASANLGIVRGRFATLKEVKLHVEHFSW